MTRTRMASVALIVAGAIGLLGTAACSGPLGTTTSVGAPIGRDKSGDLTPKKVVEGASSKTSASKSQKKSAEPSASKTVALPALKQPKVAYPDPTMPSGPKKSADEIKHIIYRLNLRSWKAAGIVDPKTKTTCKVDEDDLIKIGTHKFRCAVKFSGASVDYQVVAKTKSKDIDLQFTTNYLPLSEEKAVYEATRQSFKPARVTCDIVDVETVRLGKNDGFTCWVTDVENNRTTYFGEMLPSGALAIRPDEKSTNK